MKFINFNPNYDGVKFDSTCSLLAINYKYSTYDINKSIWQYLVEMYFNLIIYKDVLTNLIYKCLI